MNTFAKRSVISTDELFSQLLIENRSSAGQLIEGIPQTAFATGFHVYTQINLTLPLAAAEDDKSAQLYIELLAEYALIGETAASIVGARLLEVQGDRLHFLVEDSPFTAAPDVSSWQRLLDLANIMIHAAYERLEPKAGEHWKGSVAAADYGNAALLFSQVGGGSIVSLSVAANRPAKRLGQEPAVPAGFLAVPSNLVPKEFSSQSSRGWTEINVRVPTQAVREFMNTALRDAFGARMAAHPLRDRNLTRLTAVDRNFFEAIESGSAISPVRLQGFCFRADLDGFSKQVAEAFNSGPDAVLALVKRFHTILDVPLSFAAQLSARTVILPWAGDCCTILILPRYGESFTSFSNYIPFTAALKWHKSFTTERKYGEAVGTARWSLGVAAGDSEEGNSGQMLLLDLHAAGKSYRVAAGWGVRRSADAYQRDGVVAGDTVTTQTDRKHLLAAYGAPFKDFGSTMARASIEELKKAEAAQSAKAAASTGTQSIMGVTTPSPKPFHEPSN